MASIAALLFATGPATVVAQQLWRVEEAAGPSVSIAGRNGLATSPAGAEAAGPFAAGAAAIQVETDYLRLGFGYLRLPLANGSAIEVENAVFEDRGGGDLLWTGEVPGAGYESVLFTVRDGHLVGWFQEPGGTAYAVRAGPGGRGTLAPATGPSGDWCGVEAGPGVDRFAGSAYARGPDPQPIAAHRPGTAISGSSDGPLDILLLYDEEAAFFWRNVGGPAVGIQQLADFLNMAFRNGAIRETANLIPVPWTPERSPHPDAKGGHYNENLSDLEWHDEMEWSPTVAALSKRHKADLVHFVTAAPKGYIGGQALLMTSLAPAMLTGWSLPHPRIFAHEIGHNLGGDHEPASFGDFFAEARSLAVRPFAFGHQDLGSCTRSPGYANYVCPATIMSTGAEASDRGFGTTFVPFYSSVRHNPNGWTIGIAGEREVERLFHETVPIAVRGSEAADRTVRYPGMSVRWLGRDAIDSARVTFDGAFERSHPGVNLLCRQQRTSRVTCPHVVREGSSGATLAGLRPGGRYRFWFHRQNDERLNGYVVDGPASDLVVELAPPDFDGRAPAAPSNLRAFASGADGVRLDWRGKSPAGGFEIWYSKWSSAPGGSPPLPPDESPPPQWRRWGELLAPHARSARIDGLVAEEDQRVTQDGGADESRKGRYSFVVVARNDIGFSASETLDYEFMPGPFPPPTADGYVPDCVLRPSGLRLDGFWVNVCVETPGGERRRAWNYELGADGSGLLYFFDRDNVELLVKVLDGCAINGHRWVFAAPVTTLGFRLEVSLSFRSALSVPWHYDSERRPQEDIIRRMVGNPQGKTARTVSDLTAFPCSQAEVAAARAKAADAASGYAAFVRSRGVADAGLAGTRRLGAGSETDCEPERSALTLSGGYNVYMCYETYAGETGEALDWGLDSSQSGLLFFFERGNAEVLVKVLDGCGVNGHRWVFVAPVTDLAFNLRIESPAGQVWTHRNALGRTADSASDTVAFPCGASQSASVESEDSENKDNKETRT